MAEVGDFHFHYIVGLKPLGFVGGVVEEAGAVELEEAAGAYGSASDDVSGEDVDSVGAALDDFGEGPVHVGEVAFAY